MAFEDKSPELQKRKHKPGADLKDLSKRENVKKQHKHIEPTVSTAKKASTPPPDCAICCEEFSESPLRKPFICTNDKCKTRYCVGCKDEQLKRDWRCPFCRCWMDGAYMLAPNWKWLTNEDEPDFRLEVADLDDDFRDFEFDPEAVPASDEETRGIGYRTPASDDQTHLGFHTTASDDVLWNDFRNPYLHFSANAELVCRGVCTGFVSWEMSFRGSGVPEQWLREQEEELQVEVHRLGIEGQERSFVWALRERWRYEREMGLTQCI